MEAITIMEDNQRGKRVIKDHSGEGSHPGRSIHFYINCTSRLIINSAGGWIHIKVSGKALTYTEQKLAIVRLKSFFWFAFSTSSMC